MPWHQFKVKYIVKRTDKLDSLKPSLPGKMGINSNTMASLKKKKKNPEKTDQS